MKTQTLSTGQIVLVKLQSPKEGDKLSHQNVQIIPGYITSVQSDMISLVSASDIEEDNDDAAPFILSEMESFYSDNNDSALSIVVNKKDVFATNK